MTQATAPTTGAIGGAARSAAIRGAAPQAQQSAAAPMQTAAAIFLKEEGVEALRRFEAARILADVEEMFEDAFLYGPRAAHEDGESYTFEDRENLLYFVQQMRRLVPELCVYGRQAVSGAKEVEAVRESVENFMEGAFDVLEIIPVLERAMITTALYKYTKYLGSATDGGKQGSVYETFTLLRAFLRGYIPKNERPQVAD